MKLLKGVMKAKHTSLSDTSLSTAFRLPNFMFGASLEGDDLTSFERLQRLFKSLTKMRSEKGSIVQMLEISDDCL